MATVGISRSFRVVIPKPIRDSLHLAAGQKLQAIADHDRIELMPVRRLRDMRGFLGGMDTSVARERDRPMPRGRGRR